MSHPAVFIYARIYLRPTDDDQHRQHQLCPHSHIILPRAPKAAVRFQVEQTTLLRTALLVSCAIYSTRYQMLFLDDDADSVSRCNGLVMRHRVLSEQEIMP